MHGEDRLNIETQLIIGALKLAEFFISDKTRTASLLYGFKNEPFGKFIVLE